jgi:dTDP-4-dehydrorhamnose reductase
MDQIRLSGHHDRLADLDLFAGLGIKALRYPVLIERVAPDSLDNPDWSWTDERLGRLREIGIRPIVGLVHHGSGPPRTNLLDAGFADEIAAFAAMVAERYPWVDAYTPINEPLTTARFSGLYGHWYPHAQDDASFARMLVNQIEAVRRSMAAIRKVRPDAQLVQTDDLGKTFSTPEMAWLAERDNARRWLTWDLLTGRVDRCHPCWPYFDKIGADRALDRLRDEPCPPDIIGINYYVTSERFLDHRPDRYPAYSHCGTGPDRYTDIVAARAVAEGQAGAGTLLAEAWERYGLPLAVTEAHIGCTTEEQMRWFHDIWEAGRQLRSEGVDVRAVTAWALLGAFDWDSLLTKPRRNYEPGAFDLRSDPPRPTGLARMLAQIGREGRSDHPVLDIPGWWRRDAERLEFAPVNCSTVPRPMAILPSVNPRPILITGATGTLGQAFARLCRARHLAHVLVSRQELDIAEPVSVSAAVDRIRPWAIINTAGFVRVDDAEGEHARCFRENTDGPAVLAAACARQGVSLVSFSSDLVFDGEKRSPYTETDVPQALNVYGQSKLQAEARVLAGYPEALMIRTSAFFGPWDRYNFVTQTIEALRAERRVRAADDLLISPTFVPDLVEATLDLLVAGQQGIWHLANDGELTWADLAREAALRAGLDPGLVEPVSAATFGWPARRPAYSVLTSARAGLMPSLDKALARYFEGFAASRCPAE